jgi:hypothetical protein
MRPRGWRFSKIESESSKIESPFSWHMRLPGASVALIFDARINSHPIKTTAPSNIMKSSKNRLFTKMSVICALVLSVPLQAATVVWSTITAITTSTDVVTTGTTVLAAHAKWNPAVNETVNGVTFTATPNNNVAQSFTAGAVTLAFNTSNVINDSNVFLGSKQLAGADADSYERTVSNAWEFNGGGTMTLTGLTLNQEYLVQFWVADFREYTNDRAATIGSAGTTINTSPLLSYLGGDGTNSDSGRGVFITGTFTADGTTQAFPINVAGVDNTASINAFQLRAIPEPTAALLGSLGLLGLLRRRRG